MFDDGFSGTTATGSLRHVGRADAPNVASSRDRADAVGLGPHVVAQMRSLLTRLDPAIDVADSDGSRSTMPDQEISAVHRTAGSELAIPGLTQVQCIELLRELEDLKSAAAGAQAVVTAHLARSRSVAEEATGVPAAQRCRGLAGEVALARRVSPHRGGQHLGLATALGTDMPHTLAALRRGTLSEWRATVIVRESICLSATDRRALDEELCAEPARLDSWGDKRLAAEAKKAAYRLDPHSIVRRAARAEQDRRVSVRPAPDTMAYLTALLPVTQAVATQAALLADADAARNTGDERTRGQVMADTLVERVTGRAPTTPADIQIQLVMSDRTLLGAGDEPAEILGHGPLPAPWAREIVDRALGAGDTCGVWVHRVFTDRVHRLIAMESRGRLAPPGLAGYVTVRDGGTCRTPYCDAPVRHVDHVVPHRSGGPTSEPNLAGTCERCNYTKDLPGWSAAASSFCDQRSSEPRAGPALRTCTPTGHTYTSAPPALPRTG